MIFLFYNFTKELRYEFCKKNYKRYFDIKHAAITVIETIPCDAPDSGSDVGSVGAGSVVGSVGWGSVV